MIYLNNAEESFYIPESVGAAMAGALGASKCRSGGWQKPDSAALVQECREKIAARFGVPGGAAQVRFAADEEAALETALAGRFGAGAHVVTSALEPDCVLRPLRALEAAGVSLTLVPADRRGRLDPAALENAIRPETKGIVLSHASGLCGNVYDVGEVGRMAHAHGLLFVVNAAQTAGLFPLDMDAQNIDVLCFSACRALEGPQGVGVLCVRAGVAPDTPRAQSRNVPGIAGLSAALDVLEQNGMDVRRAKAQSLARRFFIKCYDIDSLRFYGAYFDFTARCPIVALNVSGIESAAAAEILAERYGVCVSATAAGEESANAAFGTGETGMLRFAFSAHNTEQDADRAALALRLLTTE